MKIPNHFKIVYKSTEKVHLKYKKYNILTDMLSTKLKTENHRSAKKKNKIVLVCLL